SFATLGATNIDTINSTINSVTVFREGAQVYRTAKINVPRGTNTLTFVSLTASLDPSSIQVKADGEFTLLSVSHRIDNFTVIEKEATVAALEKEINKVDRQIRRLQTKLRINKDEEDLLQANRDFSGEQTGLAADDLQRGVDYHRERLTEIRLSNLELSEELTRIQEERSKTLAQIDELSGKRLKKTSQVLVKIAADEATQASFILSYLVQDASWTPNYDIRVKDVTKPVSLTYRAEVAQNTGEIWKDVKLTLSTGNPSESAQAPSLTPWRLQNRGNGYAYLKTEKPNDTPNFKAGSQTITGIITDAETGDPLIGATVYVQGSSTGTVADIDGRYSLQVPEGATEISISYTGYERINVPINNSNLNVALESGAVLDEVVVIGYGRPRSARRSNSRSRIKPTRRAPKPVPVKVTRKITTVNFEIVLPYTIPADGKAQMVEINKHNLPVYYSHVVIPKKDPDAFLTAAVTKWEQYNLLSGEVQLFFEGTYLGQSYLDVSTLSDTLKLSLGRDKGIIVERHAVEEFQSNQFIGSKQKSSRGWEIVINNQKNAPVDITILDQVPISSNSNIDVKVDLPSNAEYNEEIGQLRWRLQLAPSEQQRLRFSYNVRYPKHVRLQLE
ncbi:MAG: mucoidy inhibitor MuiA family protein, partial [Bacteroidota bacterium]